MSDLFPETIRTDRLRLERLESESVDVLDLYAICSADPGIEDVTQYVTWEPHETPKETQEFLEHVEAQREAHDGCTYRIVPRESEDDAGEFAGLAGFEVDWETRSMEPGIWLRKRFWGRGYSGERAAAFMHVAFDRLDLELVSVTAHVDNERSNRAVETYVSAHGGRREGVLRNFHAFDGEPVDCYRYTVAREEWLESGSDVSVMVGEEGSS